VKALQLLFHDRHRRQRGSVLSALLIVVAFVSILVGALLTEVTDAFVMSRDLVSRVQSEATVSSALELGINKLQSDVSQINAVPTNCTQDSRTPPPSPITLNGLSARIVGQQSCLGIVPEVTQGLASGSFALDGVHDTIAGRNRYLVSDTSGQMYSYDFSTGALTWQLSIGGPATAPPLTKNGPGGSVDILVPVTMSGGGCSRHCVLLFNETSVGRTPSGRCIMAASATVGGQPAPGVNFPDYAYFGDSGGNLYVYNTRSANCGPAALTSAGVGNGLRVVGVPLVFSSGAGDSRSDDLFVLVTSSSDTRLQHWSYTEPIECQNNGGGDNQGDCDNGHLQPRPTLTLVASRTLGGSNAVGYSANSTSLPLTLAVTTSSGRLDLATINRSFSMPQASSTQLPNGQTTTRAPYWCSQCRTRPNQRQDLIGVGTTRGSLYLYDTGLNQAFTYDGRADLSHPSSTLAMTSSPMADSNGEWYVGANDGWIYDVEIPVSGVHMFNAARFGPGVANQDCLARDSTSPCISSSPMVGDCLARDSRGPCMFFGSTTAGSFFARIGITRISDLRACLSSANGPCTGIPELWARVQVGPARYWTAANGVYVQGWSFYSP
jgi:hypothetical protein